MKYQFVYLKICIFKCSYRTIIYSCLCLSRFHFQLSALERVCFWVDRLLLIQGTVQEDLCSDVLDRPRPSDDVEMLRALAALRLAPRLRISGHGKQGFQLLIVSTCCQPYHTRHVCCPWAYPWHVSRAAARAT